MSYAWVIDQDHLADSISDDTGLMGPSAAPTWMCNVLEGTTKVGAYGASNTIVIYTFKMYDDDGILYYTGRMITDEGQTEEACYGPLGDYGYGGAGCVDIRYPGHPEMDCG